MQKLSMLLCGCASLALVLFFLVAPARADLLDGLYAYWPLDGDTLDATDNGFDGTGRNGPLAFSPGMFGDAVDLNGNNQDI